MLDYVELPCAGKPALLMVWLHGLGADGYDLEPLAEMLGLAGIRHVFPHAPIRPVTLNGGMSMRAWYDIAAPDLQWQEDGDGIRTSARQVSELIDKLGDGSALPVVLAGFSQGAVISLAAAVSGVHNLIGVVAMSGYVPRSLAPSLSMLQGKSLLMMHGEQDEIVPFALGKAGRNLLSDAGVEVAWHSYAMPHTICQQQILDVSNWLRHLSTFSKANRAD